MGREQVGSNDVTREVLFDNIGAEFIYGKRWTEGPFCLAGCVCWTARAGGGNYIDEVEWTLKVDRGPLPRLRRMTR